MVKNFSVDWLAQSHHSSEPTDGPVDSGPVDIIPNPSRPHVPCMVQPRPPTSYNKVHLQLKQKNTRIDSTTTCPNVESRCLPLHLDICSSPSVSENSGYSSGYDSEAASSECPSVEEGSEEERDGPKRRARTRFTPEQIEKLEKIFCKHKYPEAADRIKTALKLNLSETQVRTWFQNRRMKLKREVQDLRVECLVPGLPMVPFQSAYIQQHL
ncbi:hypothetical protein DPEC_G00041050, partial [Dallia pectoralis]